MQLNPIVSLYLDIRKLLKSGRYMLKLRVTFNERGKFRQKYYSTGIEISKASWVKMRSGSVPFSLRKMRDTALKFEAQANEIIATHDKITPDLFEALFVGKYSGAIGMSILFEEEITRMEAEGRVSTASAYRCAMVSLKEYRGDFPFEMVDVEFLEGYERWMLTKKNPASLTTIGFYLRAFRSIFNIACERRIVSRDLYPFGTKAYVIPKGNNIKKALSRKEKTLLGKVKSRIPEEKKAIAMWMFSYYCNGMNFTDMAYLKETNVQGDIIVFVRRKTMRTVRHVKQIVVPIRPEVRAILKAYGNHSPYLFGVITESMDAKEKYKAVQLWIKQTNLYVNRVAGRLGIVGKVNTYNARHTFATALLQGNANPKEISESLGHSSIAVTESYLKGLDLEKAKKLSKLL